MLHWLKKKIIFFYMFRIFYIIDTLIIWDDFYIVIWILYLLRLFRPFIDVCFTFVLCNLVFHSFSKILLKKLNLIQTWRYWDSFSMIIVVFDCMFFKNYDNAVLSVFFNSNMSLFTWHSCREWIYYSCNFMKWLHILLIKWLVSYYYVLIS